MREPMIERPHRVGNGIQRLYRFPNGYGASVVRFMIGAFGGSYGAENGLWELAVTKYTGDKFKLTYETPITNGVEGRLTEHEVDALLARIEALPASIGD